MKRVDIILQYKVEDYKAFVNLCQDYHITNAMLMNSDSRNHINDDLKQGSLNKQFSEILIVTMNSTEVVPTQFLTKLKFDTAKTQKLKISLGQYTTFIYSKHTSYYPVHLSLPVNLLNFDIYRWDYEYMQQINLLLNYDYDHHMFHPQIIEDSLSILQEPTSDMRNDLNDILVRSTRKCINENKSLAGYELMNINFFGLVNRVSDIMFYNSNLNLAQLFADFKIHNYISELYRIIDRYTNTVGIVLSRIECEIFNPFVTLKTTRTNKLNETSLDFSQLNKFLKNGDNE